MDAFAIIFVGDFSQLEPIQGEPLPDFRPWHDWVNCYMELQGYHRFAHDTLYSNIMKRF